MTKQDEGEDEEYSLLMKSMKNTNENEEKNKRKN
jgi:hypothetical protein